MTAATITRAAVVAAARSWIGTPFRHQGRSKGAGVDCAGLIAGVTAELDAVPRAELVTELRKYEGYARRPDGVSIVAVLDKFATAIDPATATDGDVLVIRFRHQPQHLGFVGTSSYGEPTIIHALCGAGVRVVTEHRIDERWRSRVVAAYRMPGVAA